VKTDSTYHLSIQQRSRTSIRINVPIDADGIERVVLNGTTFGLQSVQSGFSKKRVVLSRRQREEIGEKIDDRFRAIQREQPKVRSYQIYSKISQESVSLLGFNFGPREVEGRHSRYLALLQKRRRQNEAW
jgi:hypothetical protein